VLYLQEKENQYPVVKEQKQGQKWLCFFDIRHSVLWPLAASYKSKIDSEEPLFSERIN
jgi:hypothetical protein